MGHKIYLNFEYQEVINTVTEVCVCLCVCGRGGGQFIIIASLGKIGNFLTLV